MEHVCTSCDKSFAQKWNLQRHLRSSTCQKTKQHQTELECPKCEKKFSKRCNLDRHIKSGVCDKDQTKHQCTSCQTTFSSKKNLENHILKDHPADATTMLPQCRLISTTCQKTKQHQAEFECPKCEKKFSKKSSLDRHLKSGICVKNQTKYQCKTCQRSFSNKINLEKHNLKEHPTDAPPLSPQCQKTKPKQTELTCPKCEKKFSKKSSLDRHLKSGICVKNQTKYQCKTCQKSFSNKINLEKHNLKEHPTDAPPLSPQCQKTKLKQAELTCPKCEKKFSKKSSLDRHLQSGICDKEQSKHQCKSCQSTFSNKRSLEKHILKDHPTDAATLLPKLTCKTCLKTFPQKEHLELHTEKGYCEKREQQHTCPECGKIYKFRKTMLRHMRDFHPKIAPPIKPHRLADVGGYHCSCGETFVNGREYRTHKDRVHIRKPEDTTTKRMTTFICKECEQQFDRKSELIEHRNEKHPPEDVSSDDDELPKHFKCPYEGCQERFQSRAELAEHKNVHREGPREQEENRAICNLCGEQFETTDEVRRHQMDDHDVPGSSVHLAYLRCPHPGCNSRFDKRKDLINHRTIQHTIQCERCDRRFESENELKIHSMDDHDPNDDPESEEGLLEDLELLLDTTSAKSLYTKIGVDIVDKAGEKLFKSTRTRQSFKLTPKALRLCEVGLALEVLHKVIGSLFKRIVEKGGYIQIKVLSDSLDTPIVMPLIKVDLFDPLVLLNYIESVMSSKDELALDQTLTFDVIHVEDINGSGYRLNTMTMESFIQRRAGIFDPKNYDNRCLGLCLAAWELIDRLRNAGEDLRRATFFKDPHKCHELKIITTRLYAEAGVDPEKQCGENELQRFQHLFNERHGKQIIVLDEKHEHIFTGQPEKQRGEDQVFLLWYGKHYSLIWNLEEFIGKRNRFCHRCMSLYKANKHHRCEDICPQCERPNCEAMENPETIIECDRCNITFKHFECYLAHMGSQRVCVHKRYRCLKCLCIRYTDQKHDCNKKARCPHCNEEVDLAVHLCKVQEPSEKARLGGSDKFNVIYFDAETGKDEDGKLVPYNICYAVNCEKCIDIKTENCEQCGPRYGHYYGWNSAFEFCDWLTTNKRVEKHRTILTAHNSAKFDAYFIYEYAALIGSRPKLQFRANDLLSFRWKRIQLKDSYQFMKCSLDKLPSILGLGGVQKGFFAYRLADREPGLNYRGPIPPEYDFMTDKMSDEKLKEFYKWYIPLKNDPNYVYDLKAESLKYCYMDVKILESAWKQFRLSCLKLTDGKVDPLLGSYFTLASFSAAIYKSLFMHDPIGIVPQGGYRNPKRTGQSWQGSAYLDFLNHQRQNEGKVPLVCANNSPGEVKIGPYKVDAYCTETGDVEEILGCYWHAHCSKPDDCLWKLRKTKHPTRKPLTFEDVNLETITRLKRIEETGRTVHKIWTCEIVKEMSTNPVLKAFMKDGEMLKRYKNPLDPSTAVFGGRVESFKPRIVLTEEQILQGYTIEYVDFCSLYPFVQWWFEFTTMPHPTVIVERAELNRLLEHLREFVTILSENFGLCYCKVLPPQGLEFAVLPYRTRNKTVFTLCRTCAEQDLCDVCEHEETERILEGTYTFYELLKAVQRGYRVRHIFELWDYGPEKGKIFADYVSKMIKLKTQHSPVPAQMTAEEFCDLWNERVPGIDLRPEELSESPAMRQSAKILMNSLWGKFCERASKSETMLINNYSSLKRVLDDRELTVSRIEQLSGRSLVVSYQQDKHFLTESSMYNPVIGAYVTAYARTTLLEKCLEVVGDRALYCDTDSLVYLSIPGQPEPIRGEALGQLANELKHDEFINCFQCIAPKTWRAEVSVKTNEGWRDKRTIVKSKGIYLYALGSAIKNSFDKRQLWNDLIDMRLVEEDGSSARQSIKEFYDSLKGYRLPHDLVKPCLEAFMQQKWFKSRSDKKASGVFVPQPKLIRDRFTAKLKEALYSRKIIRFRHDKSMLLNSKENWPENRRSTRPYGYIDL